MKVSVSLTEDDLAFLDQEVREGRATSRSGAVHSAIRAMRNRDLEQAYGAAFGEFGGTEDQHLWDSTLADGLSEKSEAGDVSAPR